FARLTPSHPTSVPTLRPSADDVFAVDTRPPEIYTLSLHDALPISSATVIGVGAVIAVVALGRGAQQSVNARISALGTTLLTVQRSEEHTSELQSQSKLVCRLLLDKKRREGSEGRCAHCRESGSFSF